MNVYKSSAKVRSIKHNFINERILSYWNKLPINVRSAISVDKFKENLQNFKVNTKCGNLQVQDGNFWEISDKVLSRIEGESYLDNKLEHNKYLSSHPFDAMKKSINLR